MMKRAFLILGAQRSGTSATSHVLSLFGVDFGKPEDFIQFDHNPIFFELKWVNEDNNKLIKTLGYQYTDFFLPIEANFATVNTAQIEAEIEELIGYQWQEMEAIGIKDPRISLTFPIWEKILLGKHYQLNPILVFRSPASFLQSNQKLLYSWENWTKERHLDFWLQHNLAAIYFTRNYLLTYVNYDRLIQSPLEEAQKLASFFNFDAALVAQAARAVSQSYYHHSELAETGNLFVDNCYKLLCSNALSPLNYLDYRSQLSQCKPSS